MSALLCFVACMVMPGVLSYDYDIKWFEDMPLDHFSYADNKTFRLRYLVNSTSWVEGAPIFFYCGNEGDITLFAANTGFMWEHAPSFKAMVVFAEHRFYGETKPFGKESFKTPSNLGYLSSEQALADYAVLLRSLKSSTKGAAESPVIAFGGSYGGMLAAWFRMKYPDTVIGSLAASAPILQFSGVTECNAFSKITTRTFKNSGEHCAENIRRFHGVIADMIGTDDGRAFLNEEMRFCPDSTLNTTADLTALYGFLTDAWGYLAMIDYPYETNFVAHVPGWPVKAACKFLTDETVDNKTLVQNVYQALSVYTNYSGQLDCINIAQHDSSALNDNGWNFQSCTEMVMPMCNDADDMFPPQKWNLDDFTKNCQKTYGVTPRPNWAITNYGGPDLRAASNIIFSNGLLDPWSGGGVLSASEALASRAVHVIKIASGAHHYDLRRSHANDTEEITKVRSLESKIIRKWLKRYAYELKMQRQSRPVVRRRSHA